MHNQSATFMEQLQVEDRNKDNVDEEDEDIEQVQNELRIKNFKEAVASLEEVQKFAESRGHLEVSMAIGSSVDTLASLQSTAVTQRTLMDYFSPQ